ncbi:hypothetical protein ACLM44_03610 [Synechococcus sp. W2B2]|uniref:hypothetical protein n=1 Tax=unclassified Synechococcus TaxID=2626047 RepID=UPI0012E9DA97|nr:hypothetical protein [Synechococcus sp. WH 7805]
MSLFAPTAARCPSHQDLALMRQQLDQAKRSIDLPLFLVLSPGFGRCAGDQA